jgi:hypothetical protein
MTTITAIPSGSIAPMTAIKTTVNHTDGFSHSCRREPRPGFPGGRRKKSWTVTRPSLGDEAAPPDQIDQTRGELNTVSE